jgi:nicotinate phosphoribosyltransferase
MRTSDVDSRWVNDDNAAMLTDLYELTMLESYFAHGMNAPAVFDLFIRRLPPARNYLVACGLDDVLHYLETFSFSAEHLSYLDSLNRFSSGFLDFLSRLRFTGDVYAAPEGTVIFANEPLLEIVAPLTEAQIVETFVMNQMHFQTLLASKAARVISAARGRVVIDYGLRRMHGADAGLKSARAFYIAGIDGTSNVLAGKLYGIPVSGTMAHSFVQAHDSEYEAFRHYMETFPEGTLLVDTYDAIDGVQQVIRLARDLGPAFRVRAIRLDSGDIAVLARQARRMLDEAGLTDVKIVASSGIDEYAIEDLVRGMAPIDGFGVGSHMGVSADVPFLDAAYKLVEYAGTPRLKLSRGKALLPGRKQIFREFEDGIATHDVIAHAGEHLPGTPLLKHVMSGGRRTGPPPSLDESRAFCRQNLNQLPPRLLSLAACAEPYSVTCSRELSALEAECRIRIKEGH